MVQNLFDRNASVTVKVIGHCDGKLRHIRCVKPPIGGESVLFHQFPISFTQKPEVFRHSVNSVINWGKGDGKRLYIALQYDISECKLSLSFFLLWYNRPDAH